MSRTQVGIHPFEVLRYLAPVPGVNPLMPIPGAQGLIDKQFNKGIQQLQQPQPAPVARPSAPVARPPMARPRFSVPGRVNVPAPRFPGQFPMRPVPLPRAQPMQPEATCGPGQRLVFRGRTGVPTCEPIVCPPGSARPFGRTTGPCINIEQDVPEDAFDETMDEEEMYLDEEVDPREGNWPQRGFRRGDVMSGCFDGRAYGGQMVGGVFSSISDWAKSMSDRQLDRIKDALSFGQKLALRAITKENNEGKIVKKAEEFVRNLRPDQKQAIREALTPEQRQGFYELTGVTI